MEGYIHEPTHYYYFSASDFNYTNFFTHLSEAIREAKKLYIPIDIYNSEGIIVHSLPIHEF